MSQQSSRGARWERLKPLVWEGDGWACTSCGNWLEREHPNPAHDATVDHVIAKAAGGRDELDNLTACAAAATESSRTRLSSEWIGATHDGFPSGSPHDRATPRRRARSPIF
ncbi:HNH endonuclease [Microbacterium plantarum]|uniref:HNH endonuclease n=1 Tax=Microbacterium plantarum TaxID=1816425 RepID=UPI0034DE261F